MPDHKVIQLTALNFLFGASTQISLSFHFSTPAHAQKYYAKVMETWNDTPSRGSLEMTDDFGSSGVINLDLVGVCWVSEERRSQDLHVERSILKQLAEVANAKASATDPRLQFARNHTAL